MSREKTKLEMLREIAYDCIKPCEDGDNYKARHFSYMCSQHKSVAEVKALYAEWKHETKDKFYFETEILGYTEVKKRAFF